MSVCTSFQVLTQLRGCTNFSRNERKGSGGSHEASIQFTRLEGLKRIRFQIAYWSVDRCQDRMLGWVSIFVLWDTCSGCRYYCSGKPHLIQVLFVVYPTLLHVKPVNAVASRASSSRLK